MAERFAPSIGYRVKIKELDDEHVTFSLIRKQHNIEEGNVVPFKKPTPRPLTWQQVPVDVLKLAYDWYWADFENSGYQARIDPKGLGNGTKNLTLYLKAQLEQRGWTIEHNDENDPPGEFNLLLKNKQGQSVLLNIDHLHD